jgi:hypothetical protein
MPRFYFDTVVNGETAHDDVGLELASLDAARHEALHSAAEMAVDLARTGKPAEITVKVRGRSSRERARRPNGGS